MKLEQIVAVLAVLLLGLLLRAAWSKPKQAFEFYYRIGLFVTSRKAMLISLCIYIVLMIATLAVIPSLPEETILGLLGVHLTALGIYILVSILLWLFKKPRK